jgi:hypothetical protein
MFLHMALEKERRRYSRYARRVDKSFFDEVFRSHHPGTRTKGCYRPCSTCVDRLLGQWRVEVSHWASELGC